MPLDQVLEPIVPQKQMQDCKVILCGVVYFVELRYGME